MLRGGGVEAKADGAGRRAEWGQREEGERLAGRRQSGAARRPTLLLFNNKM